jgi:hypothetical protein
MMTLTLLASYLLFLLCAVLLLYAGAACATIGWMIAYLFISFLCAGLFIYAGWWALMPWATITIGIILHGAAAGHWHGGMHGHGRAADWLGEHLHLRL